jgi:sarcosine oxidase subunit alpha
VPDLVHIELDGRRLELPLGQSLAAALANAEVWSFEDPGPRPGQVICAMGVCFACQLRVDGERRRACRVRVRAGMRVETGGASS